MRLISFLFSFLFSFTLPSQHPNILIIVADDLGIDALNGYDIGSFKPSTPHIDALRASGLSFTNTWATPQCTPTRAAIMSGKYGIKTGVMRPPGNLDTIHPSFFTRINQQLNGLYSTALIGKWHISSPPNADHPRQHGIDHFEGILGASVEDYFNWEKTTNEGTLQVNEYATTHLTNSSISWINQQNNPWILWLSHVAPHAPFHNPPDSLFTIPNTTDRANKYFAAVEAMDHEIGRLLENISEQVLKETFIIFIGDNGTPGPALQFYPDGHGKSSIFEGGIRVPMIISGEGVPRQGEKEESLTHTADIYATILELVGIPLDGGISNSLSLKPILTCSDNYKRPYIYTDYMNGNTMEWAVRNNQFKLIENENGEQYFFDIEIDLQESNNLINTLSTEQQQIYNALKEEATIIREGWSCNDGIRNGNETTIDDCLNDCSDEDVLSNKNIGCCASPEFPSIFYEFVEGNERNIYTNDFPNHDYCFNPNIIPEPTTYLFKIDLEPEKASGITYMTRENGRPARYFGVALNGVIMAPAPATPFIFENPNTGQFNWEWVFEPTNNQGDGRDLVSLDCASGHTGPQGYHYHGEMFEYVDNLIPDISNSTSPPETPIHLGWASDGFPIVYRFGPDANGQLKELLPSYQLRRGLRPGDGINEPCGPYSGKYTRDYEYICGKADLDECNGIDAPISIQTSLGEEVFDYYYVISSDFPQIPRCLTGNPSPDFENGSPSFVGIDRDGDGFVEQFDCDDSNPQINPNATEIPSNDIDENCDGLLTSTLELNKNGFKIGPNPSSGAVFIHSDYHYPFETRLFSQDGKLLHQEKYQSKGELKNLYIGSYILQVLVDGKMIGNQVIIIQ